MNGDEGTLLDSPGRRRVRMRVLEASLVMEISQKLGALALVTTAKKFSLMSSDSWSSLALQREILAYNLLSPFDWFNSSTLLLVFSMLFRCVRPCIDLGGTRQ